MQNRRFIQFGWVVLLTALLLGITITPARAASNAAQHARASQATTNINATIYFATSTLSPVFQNRIDQQIPGAVTSAITTIVGNLPAADRGWATQMATTLIQPSATLLSLNPQQGGLATALRVSLYPGDPQPVIAKMLVTFSVMDSTTVQVTVQPVAGSPSLVSGPIATFQIPVGQLSSISATPTCGDAALAVSLQFPISLGQGQSTPQALQGNRASAIMQQPSLQRAQQVQQTQQVPASTAGSVDSYVEIPASSLASLGPSIGTLPISSSMSAQNIQVAVQGTNLVATSDVMLGTFKLGVATTTFAPTAANGGLAVHIIGKTQLTWANIFTFPYGTYDPQIEQLLNSKLSGALTGKFTVTNAVIGANSHIPCAASDSLVLTGTTSLI